MTNAKAVELNRFSGPEVSSLSSLDRFRVGSRHAPIARAARLREADDRRPDHCVGAAEVDLHTPQGTPRLRGTTPGWLPSSAPCNAAYQRTRNVSGCSVGWAASRNETLATLHVYGAVPTWRAVCLGVGM